NEGSRSKRLTSRTADYLRFHHQSSNGSGFWYCDPRKSLADGRPDYRITADAPPGNSHSICKRSRATHGEDLRSLPMQALMEVRYGSQGDIPGPGPGVRF